ncbi:MAG TPA: hypothetical protein VEK76_01140 [Candidatus Binatia bacterium]|nr:hypothetical protein [Candidatus Binatia bacterium]
MSLDEERWLRATLRRGVDPLVATGNFEARLWSRVEARVARRPRRATQAALSGAISLALAAALVAGVVLSRTPESASARVRAALTASGAAQPVTDATHAYVWLTSMIGERILSAGQVGPSDPSSCTSTPGPLPSVTPNTGCTFTEEIEQVDVLDWTGTLRYHFRLPELRFAYSSASSDWSPTAGGIVETVGVGAPDSIVSISPDGRRALLQDGAVIDQTGRVIASLPDVTSRLGLYPVGAGWLSDDSGICLAGPLAATATSGPGGNLGYPSNTSPGSYSSLAVDTLSLSGSVHRVTTVTVAGSPSDQAVIDACDPSDDTLVVSFFTLYSPKSPLNGTVTLWAIRLSTGQVLYRQPYAATASGGGGSVGAVNGSGVGEFLWDERSKGACDAVSLLRLPSGGAVPGTAALGCANLSAISADGSRAVVTDIGLTPGHGTSLELLATGDGHVVREISLPRNLTVEAVAAPDGAHFMLLVDGCLFLVDADGNATELDAAGVSLTTDPGGPQPGYFMWGVAPSELPAPSPGAGSFRPYPGATFEFPAPAPGYNVFRGNVYEGQGGQ